MVRINVDVDEDIKTLYEVCADDSEHDTQKAYFLALLREDAEERGISVEDALSIAEDDEDEQPPLHARYDPDEYDDYLSDDEQKAIVKHDPEALINPDHVARNTTPQGWRTEVVEAMARYEFSRVSRDDVVSLCKSVGLDSNYYIRARANDKDIPGTVVERLGGDGEWDETVSTDEDGSVELAANAALLRVDGTESDYDQLREELKRADTDVLSEDAVSVVSMALYKATKEMGPDVGIDDLRDEWPDNPLALVDWYDEVDRSGWDDEYDDRGAVAKEIGDVIGEDVPEPLFGDVTAGVWVNGARTYIDNEDLPLPVLESKLRDGEEALEANPDHPNTAPVEDVLDDLRDEIEARKAEDEQENETEDADDEQTAKIDDDEGDDE